MFRALAAEEVAAGNRYLLDYPPIPVSRRYLNIQREGSTWYAIHLLLSLGFRIARSLLAFYKMRGDFLFFKNRTPESQYIISPHLSIVPEPAPLPKPKKA
jgi:hypothetical protein